MPKIALVSLIAVTLTLALGAQTPQTIPPPGSKAPVSGYTVVRSFPHDPKAFTQGLEYFDGYLFEGTGQKGQSAARKVELESGKVVQEEKLHPQYFGDLIHFNGKGASAMADALAPYLLSALPGRGAASSTLH